MTATYSYTLIALSLAVAFVAAYTALDLASRIGRETGSAKRDWIIAGAFVLGIGIWAMHFVGMLAFHLPIQLGFQVGTTMLSILPAVVAAGYVLNLIQAPDLSYKKLAVGSVIMGAGIAAMHYIGMEAIVLIPGMKYEPTWFAMSVVYSVGASAIALRVASNHHAAFGDQEGEISANQRKAVAAGIMGLAITGMHYMGMQAAIFPPNSICVSGFQGQSVPHSYQHWLVALSVSIAVMSAYTALDVSSRITASAGLRRALWLAGGGIAMGMGIWSMHFIGMLALHSEQDIAYDKLITFISVVPAIAASTFALYMVSRGRVNPRILGVSGVLMGSGIGAMHYIGMAGMRMEDSIRYDPTFFAISLLVAISASVSALWIAFQNQTVENTGQFAWRKFGSAIIMGFAIAGMHYTGMTAAHFLPMSTNAATVGGLDSTYLAVFVGLSTFLVLALAYVMAFYDARLADLNIRTASQLREANEQLNIRANDLALAMTAQIRTQAARDHATATIVDQSVEAIITTDMQGVIQSWNAAAEEIFGHRAEQAVGTRADLLYLPSTQARFDELITQLSDTELVHECKANLMDEQGQIINVLSSVSPHFDGNGQQIGKIAIIHDVTKQVQTERALREEKERAQVTLASIGDAVIVTDNAGLIQYLNPAAETLLELNAKDAIEKAFNRVVKLQDETTQETLPCPVMQCLQAQVVARRTGNAVIRSARGESIFVDDSVAPIFDSKGALTGVVAVLTNVSEQHKLAQDLRWQASHDSLTNLANRRAFEETLDHMVESARSTNNQHALLYIDLDQFKIVNDISGHAAGDQMLRDIAVLMSAKIRTGDILARLGGDEFGVLLVNCPFDDAVRIAESLRESIADFRFVSGQRSYRGAVSIGLVSITDNRQSATEVMIAADAACYVAKEKGRNRIWAEQHGVGEIGRRQSEIEWVTHLDKALEESRLLLYGQSIVSVRDAKAVSRHVEVLVRMLGDDGELVLPGVFIPAAERYGLIARIDRWVIAATLQRCAAHFRAHPTGEAMTITMNLSGLSLNDDTLVSFIRDNLKRHALPTACVICFEITETAAIGNLATAKNFIDQVRALGCLFALDDFGIGMSSFSYLKNLPVDYLKIDGSFVRDMITDPIDCALVETIHRIGKLMDVKTIAEHVADAPTLAKLTEMGVDYAQGFHISKPAPLDAFFASIERGTAH
jgi:diguanylate cyclase (GGDEF)-like protein/PAS domain S-box-containing protein